jgi:hypothetical protein
MAHKLAGAFQHASRIGNLSASKESDIHMSFEGIDVRKCCITDARRRVTIMQQFPYIVPTHTQNREPMIRDFAQFTCMLAHPRLDEWVSLNRTVESEELVHHLSLGLGLTSSSVSVVPAFYKRRNFK